MISSGIFQILLLIVPIITTPYITRIFSPADIGIFANSYGVVSIFVTISMFGIPIYGARRIAQSVNIQDQTESFVEIWRIQIIMSVFCFVGLNIIFGILRLHIIFHIQSLLILTTIFDISWFFIGIEEIRKNIFRNFIAKFLGTIAIFLFVKNEKQLYLYTFINIGATLCGNLTMLVTLHKYLDKRLIGNSRKYSRENRIKYKDSAKLMIPMLTDTLKNSISKILLGSLANNFYIGIFDQGTKIIIMVLGVMTAMSNAIVPRMSFLVSKNEIHNLNRYFEKFSIMICLFSVYCITGIISIAEFFVPVFFGIGYGEVIPVLIIGSFMILFGILNSFLMNGMIIPLSLDNKLINSSALSLGVLAISNLLLDKYLFSIGATISFLISTLFLTIIYSFYLRKNINVMNLIFKVIGSLMIILMESIIIMYIKNIISFSSILVSFFFYGFISVLISSLILLIIFLVYKMLKKNNLVKKF